jgi:hypothetical protein
MYLVSDPILKKMEPWVQFRSGSLKKKIQFQFSKSELILVISSNLI